MGDHGARQLSRLFPRRLVQWDKKVGRYRLNLSEGDRSALQSLVPQFADLLDDPARPVLRRLFPPAYSDPAHTEQQDEYRRLMQDDLVERHRAELDLVVRDRQTPTPSARSSSWRGPGPSTACG